MRQQISHFHLDEIEKLGIVDHVDLVQEHDNRRDADLPCQQDMLARLGHRSICSGDNQDGAIHLRCASDHVLDVVRVARAIDVCIVAFVARVLYVCSVNRNAAFFLFWRVID